MGKVITPEEKQEISVRMKNYWAGRRQAKTAALILPKNEAVAQEVSTPTAKKIGRPLGKKDSTKRKPKYIVSAPKQSKHAIMVTKETVVKKPYVFATVTVVKGDQVMVGNGFAKWDNVAPAWNEDFGKQIAIGRAMKQIKKEHGIVVK